MKRFEIYRTRLWPQCFVCVVYAQDIWAAFRHAKDEMKVLNPIVGHV